MSNDLFLELGDIIQINAPSNDNLNHKKFYIDYLDDNLMRILNVNTFESYEMNIHPHGNLSDESIQTISIFSKATEKGYARLNHLLPGTWVQINIETDIPIQMTGKITNLDEDMIEIEEYQTDDKIYIDFGYKGIPLDIPGLQIKIRSVPKDYSAPEVEKDDNISDNNTLGEADDDDEIVVQDRLDEDELDDILILDDDDEQGAFLVEQLLTIPEEHRRYNIDTQMTNMLDERLSVIPNKRRTKKIMNQLHIEIERFKQLRLQFSELDKNDLPGQPLRHGETHKPLTDKLYNMNQPVYWIVPSVKNTKKLYDINLIDAQEATNGVEFMGTQQTILQENELYNQFENNNGNLGEKNKYDALLQTLISLQRLS